MGVRVCVHECVCTCARECTCEGLCGGDCTCTRACVGEHVFEHYDTCDKCACVLECGGAYACVECAGLHEWYGHMWCVNTYICQLEGVFSCVLCEHL